MSDIKCRSISSHDLGRDGWSCQSASSMEWSGPPTLVGTVRAHRGEVSCLDARGGRLATGCGRGALRVWAWAAGAGWAAAAEQRAAHRYGVTAARWAPAAALLASAGVDGTARVWSRTLLSLATLAAPNATAVRSLTWAAAGRLLVGHDDGTVCVWHVPRAALITRLNAHEGAIYALTVALRGALLVTACTNGVLKVYDLIDLCRGGESAAGANRTTAPLVWEDGAHDLGALCADSGCEGTLVATGGHDALVRLWRAERTTLRAAHTLDGHTAAVTAVRWSRAAPVLASAALDRTARLWDATSATCLHVVSAHPRYLTCIAIADDLTYMVTGSNDKTFRMWVLGKLSIDDELEPPCTPLSHFAIGDLEGIGPVVETENATSGAETFHPSRNFNVEENSGSECECVCSVRAHAGAINSIATHDDLLATASSDGTVKLWRWCGERLLEEHTLEAHQYPALAVDFAAGGTLLVTAGLDGCAFIWDVQSGVQVRSLSVPGGGGGCRGGEAGGGGVRAARVSPHAPYNLLLATDDGLTPLFTLTSTDPDPQIVYSGHTEAVTCCAWSADGRVAATGAASGELRILAPPSTHHLHHDSHAHDLGVLSCDFAPPSEALHLPENHYLLATAGCDSLIKLWTVVLSDELSGASVEVSMLVSVEAHGAAVTSVRWARGGGVLVSAGADRWARVWHVSGDVTRRALAVHTGGGVEARGAGGALAAAPLAAATARLLALGTMSGELALYRVRTPLHTDDHDCTPPLYWRATSVARWIREYILDRPGSQVSKDDEALLLMKAVEGGVTGEHLMLDPIDELLCKLGIGTAEEEDYETESVKHKLKTSVREEIEWLRRPEPSAYVVSRIPHQLLCPLTHRVLREPTRAADGFTYERASLAEWLMASSAASEAATSPMTGERLASTHLAPNYALRDQLRDTLRQHDSDSDHELNLDDTTTLLL